MPFSKRKSRRGTLQRLGERRRSLTLAGLAVGAILGAALLRRGRHGEEARFEPPAGEPPAGAPAPHPRPAAGGPPPDDAPQPINAASPVDAAAAPAPAAPAPAEPATGELSNEEASIVGILAQSGRAEEDRTAVAVAASLERDAGAVAGVLRKLSAEGVVSGELRAASGAEIWTVTERGVRRLGARS